MSRTSHRSALGLLLALGFALSCADPASAPIVAPTDAKATSPVVEALSSPAWHQQARSLVAANNLTSYAGGRIYAALGIAQYRAVVEADGNKGADGTLPAHGIGAGGRAGLESRRGAVAGASAEVLAYFFPTAAATFEQRVRTEGEAGPGNVHPQFTRGLEIGRRAGKALVERAKQDGFTSPWTGSVPVVEGLWFPASSAPPAGSMLVNVTPYVITSKSQFRSSLTPPPKFGSAELNAAVADVRHIADTRTPAQLASALYWAYGAGTPTPPGYWNEVAATYIDSYDVDERTATHVFALMQAAIVDAQIACWDAKLFFWTLRPSQVDPLISLAFALPNHPSFPSGHSCASAAGAMVLSHFFPGSTNEFTARVTAAGMSRVYAGVHYRFDVTAGNDLGYAVAGWAIGVDMNAGLLSRIP
jgi:hypothetical protein